ncbi:MAG: hypothetical protein WCV82_01980 [Candidatus Paceibacterota bacterium]
MKKYSYLYIATALSFAALAVPALTNANTEVESQTTTNVSADSDREQKPIPVGVPAEVKQKMLEAQKNVDQRLAEQRKLDEKLRQNMMSSSTKSRPVPAIYKEIEARKELEARKENMAKNASGTPQIRKELEVRKDMMRRDDDNEDGDSPRIVTPLMKRIASSTMFASSTMTERLKEYRENEKQTRLDLFATKQNRLVEQLTRALENLKQIRERVSARIDKAVTESRDMTNAKALLVTADAKIATAATAIQALAAYTPPAALGAAVDLSASASVDLERPRVLGAEAIKAVNEARKALNDVVRAIAQAMGLKTGEERTATSSSDSQ